MPSRMEEGAKVEANYRGKGNWYPGKITRDRRDGTFDIAYVDGESETRVDELLIRLSGGSSALSSSSSARDEGMDARVEDFREGSKVEADYRGKGKYYPGRITRVRLNGTFDIDYDDGEKEVGIPRTLMRSLASSGSLNRSPQREALRVDGGGELVEGMSVEARFRGGTKYYPGRISRVRLNGTFDIDYADGEKETGVKQENVRAKDRDLGGASPRASRDRASLPRRMEEGAKVEANYRGKGNWYPGKITRDRRDGTFDIAYDDGESETRVDELLIRLSGGSSALSSSSSARDEGMDARVEDFREGSKVEADYRGKGKYYPGRITRVRLNGTFDIDYDDGEKEVGIPRTLMRSLASSGSLNRSPQREALRVDGGGELVEGMSVEARFRGGTKYYPGRISRVRLNGTFDIDYADGEKETGVKRENVRAKDRDLGGASPRASRDRASLPRRMEEGAKVEANYRGKGNWYPGKITRDRRDGTFDIAYDDGESETRVDELLIRLSGGSSALSSSSSARDEGMDARVEDFREGSKVEADYRGKGKYYPGRITRVRLNGTFDIDYDDGEKEVGIPRTLMRSLASSGSLNRSPQREALRVDGGGELVEGMSVEARFRGGTKYYPGRISRVRLNGTFDIDYADGEKETGVKRENVRAKDRDLGGASPRASRDRASLPRRMEEGAKVEANYRGKGNWYPGKITRDRRDGTFDIAYDDGESETRVDELLIRLSGGSSALSSSSSARDEGMDARVEDFREGSKVEADYRGKGKYYPGRITRVRLNGTFDIDYDDGEKEVGIPRTLMRSLASSGSLNRSPQREALRVDGGGELVEGMSVEARFRGGTKYYPGRISRVRLNGTFDIDYADGEKETGVKRENVRAKDRDLGGASPRASRDRASLPRRMEEGAKVEANYRGKGNWYPGKITRDRRDGTFDIAYDDGESETRVDELLIRLSGGSSALSSSSSARDEGMDARVEDFREGSKVEADYRGKGKYYPGRITRVRLNGTFDIDYDDGEKEVGIPRTLMRSLASSGSLNRSPQREALRVDGGGELVEGMSVEARFRGGTKYYPGRISRVRLNGTFDIDYADGEKETGVKRENVRAKDRDLGGASPRASRDRASLPRRMEEGAKVEANYRGKGNWYPGKITRDRRDGTFDIAYDDGESETRVDELLIRLSGGSSALSSSSSARDEGMDARVEDFREGSKVEADYRGKGKYYPGRITRVRLNGTFDIDYDDGEKEVGIPRTLMRSLASSGSLNRSPQREALRVDGGGELVEGMSVEARFRGGTKYYPGRISRVRLNGTFDIDYADGEKETGVKRENVRAKDRDLGGASPRASRDRASLPRRMEEGAKVEANYRGKGNWYPGKITRDRRDGTFDIAYDDGESETRVDELLIRLSGGSSALSSSSSARDEGMDARVEDFREGSKVEADYRGKGKYYPGRITRVRLNGTFDIDYDDGEKEVGIPRTLMRSLASSGSLNRSPQREALRVDGGGELVEGMSVEARFRGGTKYYPGRISRVRLNGTFDIDYADGEKETGVKRENVRAKDRDLGGASPRASRDRASLPRRMEEGAKVEANYRGKGNWYPGKITRDRRDGTFDIAYDDGESETRVDELLIRLSGGSSALSSSSSARDEGMDARVEDFREGSKVEADYRGKGKYYPGRITRVRLNGTFDIDYDDGEKEVGIPRTLMRSLASSGSLNRSPQREALRVDGGGELVEGMSVEARFRGGTKYYPGRISRVRLNGTFDIDYADGEKETGVKRENVRAKDRDLGGASPRASRDRASLPRRMEEGAKVEANYRGKGNWYPGKITRDRRDGTFDIAYDDGESETRVDELLIRLSGGSSALSSSSSARDEGMDARVEDFREGSKVEADYRGKGKYYPGRITRVRLNGTFDIDYDDGEKEVGIPRTLMRSLASSGSLNRSPQREALRVDGGGELVEGMSVEARFRGGTKYYPGRISRVRLNGTFDIDYADGEKETGVKQENVRAKDRDLGGASPRASRDRASLPRRMEEGAKVEANYRGKGNWYPGKITRDRRDGTFDIAYDDGESETRVDELLIRLSGGSSALSSSSSARDEGMDARVEDFREGSKVEADYRGKGKYYPGRITRVRLNGTFDIDYDDGEKEVGIPRTLMRSLASSGSLNRSPQREALRVDGGGELVEGMSVEARFRGGTKYYPGRISRVRLNGTFDIDYADGEKETGVKRENVRAKDRDLGGASPRASRDRASLPRRMEEGAKVEANYRGKGNWYPGKITRDRRDGTFDIAYDDGESETRVDELLIRLSGGSSALSSSSSARDEGMDARVEDFREGSKVEADYRGKGKYYPGRITRVRLNGTFDIDYDDGEKEVGIPRTLMRSLASSGSLNRSPQREALRVDGGGELVEGMSVEARFRGGTKYYPGRISRVRLNGTFDIDYADGEKETGVKRENVRAKDRDLGGASPRASRDRASLPRRMEEGAKVEANYRGKGNWYPGKITRDRRDGTFDIAYDDGESETRVDELLIRLSGGSSALSSSSSARDEGMDARVEDFREGSKVEADYRGKGKYYPGRITRVRLNGTFDIDYDDGEKEVGIPRTLMRSLASSGSLNRSPQREALRVDGGGELVEGMSVEARFRGDTKYYPGRISRVRLNGTFDIDYADGEKETGVKRENVRAKDRDLGGASPRASRDRASLPRRMEEGAKVEANYRGKGNWYPGKITRDRRDGTFDIAYDDGESETRVDELLIRLSGGSSALSSSSSVRDEGMDARVEDFREGSKVEADYRGKGKYYPGRITRVRLNGTFDIDYDDGEKEVGIPRTLMRSLASYESSCPLESRSDGLADLIKGDRVEIRLGGKLTWLPAFVVCVRSDGTYDVELDDGELVRNVARFNVRQVKSMKSDVSAKRAAFLDDNFGKGAKSTASRGNVHQKGDRVSCYWYRSSSLGSAKINTNPKACIILCYNSDGTYTVELESDGNIIDDVPEAHIKSWSKGDEDVQSLSTERRVNGGMKDGAFDKWAAVFEMGKEFMRLGKVKHQVPTPHSLEKDGVNSQEKLQRILGTVSVRDFEDVFERHDRYRDGEIDTDHVLLAFSDIGGDANEEELRKWSKKMNPGGRPQKIFDFTDFVIAYANIFHPTLANGRSLIRVEKSDGFGSSLHFGGEGKSSLGEFARSFGKKQLQELEKAFDAYAEKDSDGVGRLRACNVLEAFHKMNRAVTATRLQDWMNDADVCPQDMLFLSDFVAVFSFFFSPTSSRTQGRDSVASVSKLSISEISVQILQEERWRGTPDQTNAFIRRLSSGRTEVTIDCLTRIRDAFEVLDTREQGEISSSDVAEMLRSAKVQGPGITRSIASLKVKLSRQTRGTLSLPELFEHMGLEIQELCEASVTVAEAFAMLRMHLSSADVRAAADLVVRIVDTLLEHPTDPKYWQVNIRNEDLYNKLWRHDGGKALMRAVGFGDYSDSKNKDGKGTGTDKGRTTVTLAALPSDLSKVPRLPAELIAIAKSKRQEVEREIAALEGAPSVSNAVRDMRSAHSLSEVRTGVETALTIVKNVLSDPKDFKMYRVKRRNPAFQRSLGRLKGSEVLMSAIGFVGGQTGPQDDGTDNGTDSAAYVLKSLSKGGFDPEKDQGRPDAAQFKFPSLDPETERFLYRRKADLELSLRAMDSAGGDAGPTGVADVSHVLGTISSSQVQRSSLIKKSIDGTVALKRPKDKGTLLLGAAKSKGNDKKASSPLKTPNPPSEHHSLSDFLQGATPAQTAQIKMISTVFTAMDADRDGVLSVGDVRAYFRTMGRNSSDVTVRRWIAARDVDQDGAVSLAEFVASYSLQLDPASAQSSNMLPHRTSPVTSAFGAVCLGNTPSEVVEACMAAEEYVRRALDSPSVESFWRLSIVNEDFHRRIGRLFGGVKLMQALGFEPEQNGTVLALRDPNGHAWDALPSDMKVMLNSRLGELKSHEQALTEPSVSNVAAVSSAIGSLGDTPQRAGDWALAVETILTIAGNILKHPGDSKYYQINVSNPNFNRRVGKMPGALSILGALGFKEEEGGTLALDSRASLSDLEARRLEFEIGLELLKKRISGLDAVVGAKLVDVGDIKSFNMLPPRPTTAATVAAELAAATVKPLSMRDSVRSPVKKKNDVNYEEEKLKRQKAETALNQQKSLVQDLQSQISELQDVEHRNLTLRQGLTITRLDSEDKDGVMKQAAMLGRDSFAFHGKDSPGESAKAKLSNPKVTSAGRDKEKDKKKTPLTATTNNPVAALTHPARPGDTRLHVTHVDGYKKGMLVLIGSGRTAESRKIIGFGSILIDFALEHTHATGSLVRVFPATVKGIAKIDRIIAEEFIRGMLLEEIVPQAAGLGSERLMQRELNELYRHRPVLKHSYTLEKQSIIPTGTKASKGCVKGLSVHSNGGKVFMLSDSGGLSSLDLSLTMVELVNLFEDNARAHPVSEGEQSYSNLRTLLLQVEGDVYLRGCMHQLAVFLGAIAFPDLLREHSKRDGPDIISWSSFCSAVRPTSKSPPSVSVQDRDSLKSKYGVDPRTLDLLGKLFRLIDYDDDENLSAQEAKASFAELDGCFTDDEAFSKAMTRILGTYTAEQRLSAVSYFTVRAEYANILGTLPGGVALYGRLIVDTLLAPIEEDLGPYIPLSAVVNSLPQNILNCIILSSGRPVSAMLDELHSPSTRSEIMFAVMGRVLLGGAPQRGENITTECLDIVQVSSSNSKQTLYLLGSDGVVHIYDVSTSEVMAKRRVIWAEPLTQRAVEGAERFLQWRRSSGLDYVPKPTDSQTHIADMKAKSEDTQRTSALLSSFVLSLPPGKDGSSSESAVACIAVDAETGLVAVNCSVSSGSISIHEPSTLRRIYRVKAPGRANKDLADAVQSICVGGTFRGRQTPHMSVGTVKYMELWARRSLLLCILFGSKDLHVVSLLTGDTVITLSGHTDTLSCVSPSFSTGLIFTGACDCTVRVWVADECIPHRVAALGTFEDPTLHAMEKGVAHSTVVGTGTRQILRGMSAQISARLRLTPQWRRGKIVSFFDGARHTSDPHIEQHSLGVEVVFEDGTVQIYSNKVLLRNPREVVRAPKGPPLWSDPEAPMVQHQEVAVFEVDPDTAACVCARELCVPLMEAHTVQQAKKLLLDLLPVRGAESDCNDALRAVGLEIDSTMSTLTLIRRIYKYSEKCASRCDRLLASNSAPITAVYLSDSSKLLVTLDRGGGCCVWDPCERRVSLTVSNPFGPPAFIGSFPYNLVHRSNLFHGVNKDFTKGEMRNNSRKEKCLQFFVNSVETLTVPVAMSSPFPLDREALNRAIAVDSAFPDDVTIRGFIYVLRDLSTCCLQTSCFRPSLAALDSPQQFLCCPRMGSALTTLQQLYLRRSDVLRIVYVVSSAHSSLDALCDDLRQYGVLQRGYTTTPSEQIELVCFERPKGWLEQSKDLVNGRSSKDKAPQQCTGIIIAVTRSSEMRVALDFCSDIIRVKPSQVTSAWDARCDSYLSTPPNKSGTLGPGIRVAFNLDASENRERQISPFEDCNASEVLIVSVRSVDGDGVCSSALVPLMFGRASFPLPTIELDLPPCQHTAAALSYSYMQIAHTAVGRLSAYAYSRRAARSSWIGALRVFQTRVWDLVSGRAFEPTVQHDMNSVTAFSGLDESALACAVDLFTALSALRVSSSHPLLVCLDGMLAGQGHFLFKTLDCRRGIKGNINGEDDVAWKQCLEGIQHSMLMRLGLRSAELFREAKSLRTGDLDSIQAAVEGVLSSLKDAQFNVVGPIDSAVLSAALGGKMEASKGGGGGALSGIIHDTDALIVSLREGEKRGTLSTYLVQHWLACSVDRHGIAMKRMKSKAKDILLQRLSLISQPLLVAVKDSPLLPSPPFEKVIRSFPARSPTPTEGQYAAIGRKPFPSLVPGLRMEIIRGILPHCSDDDVIRTFLSWVFTGVRGREYNGDSPLLSELSALSQIMLPIQHDSTLLVRTVQGVAFAGEVSDALCGAMYEWDDSWRPLRVIMAHGGLFRPGKVNLFLLLAVRILDSLIELSDRGVVMRGLSPDTVILDGTGMKVRFLLLPIASDIDQNIKTDNEAAEAVLYSYIETCSDPLRLACIPHTNLQDDSSLNLSGSKWDVWSYGSVLFMLAFGRSPLGPKDAPPLHEQHPQTHPISNEHTESPTSAAFALFNLMMPVLISSKKESVGSAPRSSSGQGGLRVTEEEQAQSDIAEALAHALSDGSRNVLFKLVQDLSGQSMTSLSDFRSAFCSAGPVCGLSDRAVGLLWEKAMQTLYHRLCGGASSVQAMRVLLSKLPKDLSLPSAHAFAAESLGLVFTTQEFGGWVKSLSPELTAKQSPFPECAKKMFKSLSLMLEEIQWYGMFQQLLYVLSRCLNPDPHQRPSLSEIRRLALFGLVEDEGTLGRAAREAKVLVSPCLSASEFHTTLLLGPFVTDLMVLMAQTGYEDSDVVSDSADTKSRIASMHTNLEKLTAHIGCLEELVTFAVKQANNKCDPRSDESTDLGPFLRILGAESSWISSRAVEILQMVMDSDMIPGIALYVIRFLSTDAAQKSSDAKLVGGVGREKDKDTGKLSIGSRLIMRMAKFLQHLSVCLCSLSRDLGLPSVLSDQMSRDDSEEEVLVFQRILDMRVLSESLYHSCVCATLMLYTGEEAPVEALGPYQSNLLLAHPGLFKHTHPCTLHPADVPMDSRWNAHSCKLFESVLVDLVGEDGRGAHRMPLGGDCLIHVDRVVTSLVTQVVTPATMEGGGRRRSTRGAAYFIGLFKIYRAQCADDAASGGKTKERERAHLGVVTAVTLSLPTVTFQVIGGEQGKKCKEIGTERRDIVTAQPDSGSWQRLQLLLDTRCAARLQYYFYSQDPALQMSLLKACQKALGGCLQAPSETGMREPLNSVGLEFSSEGWLYGISEMLRVKVENVDLALSAVECLRLMSCKREWMRCWSVFDILPILCFLNNSTGKNLAQIKVEVKETLRLSTLHRPEGTMAMVSLRMPHAGEIPGVSGPGPLSSLLAEAVDMSFGSTLAEQANFTKSLTEWLAASFPSELPTRGNTPGHILGGVPGGISWDALFDLTEKVSAWLPKLCLTLQISDTLTGKRDKTVLSVEIACKQIQAVERVLLYAGMSGHPKALVAAITCIWAAPEKAERALVLGSAGSSGLLADLDQLATAGTYVDTFLSLRLQCQIVQTLSRLMQYGSIELLHSLLDCGVVRSVSWFLQGVVDVVRDAVKLNQLPDLAREYRHILATVRLVWDTLLSFDDEKIDEEIIDSGILQKLVEHWLPCTQSVAIPGHVDAVTSPLLTRSMALSMLRSVFNSALDSRAGPGSDRLCGELSRWLVTSSTIGTEILALQAGPVTGPKGAVSTAANMRSTAADVLAAVAVCGLQRLEQEMKDTGIPTMLLSLTTSFPPLHPGVQAAWLQWGRDCHNPKVVAASPPPSPRLPLGGDKVLIDGPDFDAEKDMNSALKEFRRHNGVPLSGADPATRASMQDMWSVINPLHSSKDSNSPQKNSSPPKYSALDPDHDRDEGGVPLLIDRMGNLVLAVQSLFEQQSREGSVTASGVTGILLDLGLRGPALSIIPTYSNSEKIDFPAFLLIYGQQCGLMAKGRARTGTPSVWVPTEGGTWHEVSSSICKELEVSARPYSIFDSQTNPHAGSSSDIWVSADDVTDILQLTGIPASTASVTRSVQALKNLLPGIPQGKLCFQELLALYQSHLDLDLDRPSGDDKRDLGRDSVSRSGSAAMPTHNYSDDDMPISSNIMRKKEKEKQRNYPGDPNTDGPGSGWTLPFRSNCPYASPEVIALEFKRLDLTGEGRLTYLTLTSALELREVNVQDGVVRRWLKENDRGGKGYVDFSDYQRIYTDTPFREGGDIERGAGVGRGGSSQRGSSATGGGVDGDQRALLRRAFARYDLDGDGFISVQDLQDVFTAQGRGSTTAELVAWVRKRDSTGRGAVTFEDFADHYQR